MTFIILMVVALGLAVWVGSSILRRSGVGEGICAFLSMLIAVAGLGSLIILFCGTASMESSEHRLISSKTYMVAEGSTFDTNGYLKFVEQTSDGKLVAQKIDAAKVEYASKTIKQVQVDTNEILMPALVPWTWGTDKHVIIK